MAVNYPTPLRSVMLLSELEQVSFIDTSAPASYTFEVKDGNTVLFSNTYTPDSDGVTVYDVDKLLESMMLTHYRTFTLVCNGDAQEVTVFKCSIDIDDVGSDFISNYYLSPMMAERMTTYGRYEVLYAYCPIATAVTVKANYYKDGAVSSKNFNLGSITGVSYVDCSPSLFAKDDGSELIGYSVECGARRAEYRVRPTLPAADPSFIYLNCFGVWETIYLTGAKETSGEYSRQQALLGGKLRNYAIDEVIKFNAHTGPIPYGADALAYDLARSKSVFILEDGGVAGDEVVILDCKTSKTNEWETMPDFTFEYRRANKRTDRLAGSRPPRIFDDSFDETYN